MGTEPPLGTPSPRPDLPSRGEGTSVVDWRRNLSALWFAEFTAIFGFSFAFPFLSIFISQDLGVHSGRDLALWTAAGGSVTGLSMAVASPIWGILGDRWGRKPMLVRSMVGGAITVGLMAFVQNPEQLVILRFLQGATSGTVAAATALVAVETPRNRVGWSLGVVTSAVALGSAFGPVLGGFAAALFGLRWVFLAAGILLLLATIPVFLIVRESPLRRRDTASMGTLALIDQRPGVRRALMGLIGAQGLVSVANSATQILLTLRLLEMLTHGVAAVTGIAFGLAGVATSAAAVFYTYVTRRLGYVRTTALAAVLMAGAIALIGISPWVAVVVGAVALNGLLSGVIVPATASMIGLETPTEAQSTIFGINASSVALGFCFGPLIAGGVAASAGVPAALGVIAVVALGLAVLLSLGTREPAR
ncbi:MAG TPA: MFS transporter [Gemmatimonadales bacterium]|nr:MFS transporter [Gemmatimonadales bacterium]HVD47023.1 MFS transporter [Candidatus Limnocylindria bacterium]